MVCWRHWENNYADTAVNSYKITVAKLLVAIILYYFHPVLAEEGG